MRFLLTIIIICWAEFNFAQQVSITNQRTIGGTQSETLSEMIPAIDGGFILLGSSHSGISGEKTDSSRGEADFWILKCDSLLNIQWQKTIGGSENDYLLNIVSTSDSNYLCIGITYSPVSGDKTVDTIGGKDIWLMKLDRYGNILWQKTYGGTNDDSGILLKNGSDDTYFIIGTSDSDSSGTKTENSRGGKDYWITKIDSSGGILWDKTIGGTGIDELSGGVIDDEGNIYLSGSSDSPASGEKTEDGYGLGDCWIVKLDSSGTIVWDKTIGGDDMDSGGHIVRIGASYYVLCTSQSDISGTKTENSRGYTDYWINKLDENGNILWDKTIGGSSLDNCFSGVVNLDGTLLVGGNSLSPISGEKTENSKGAFDYWVLDIDSTGNIIWQKDIGGSDNDEYPFIIQTGITSYYVGGVSLSNISGDKTENSRGSYDFWVVGLSVTVGFQNVDSQENRFSCFPNPGHSNLVLNVPDNFESGTVEIYSLEGKKQMRFFIENKQNPVILSTDNLKSGVYFIKLISGEKTYTVKWVKE